MSNYALLVLVIIKTGEFNRDCRCVKAVKSKNKKRQELQKVQEVESRGKKQSSGCMQENQKKQKQTRGGMAEKHGVLPDRPFRN